MSVELGQKYAFLCVANAQNLQNHSLKRKHVKATQVHNVSKSSVTIPDEPHFPPPQVSKHRSHPHSHPPPYGRIFLSLPLTPQRPSPTNTELYSS